MKVFERTKALTENEFTYCPGCTHSIIHRLVAECLEELGVIDKSVVIASVGCSVFSYNYFNCDALQSAHGRACAVATGVKRVQPDKIVFTYQGDGDLASIGMAETIHAAHRGENITVIFVNNAIYGMTGGQMAPTTLVGQKTSTSPFGRDEAHSGRPILVSEMMKEIPQTHYIERCSVHDVPNVNKTKKAIMKAFQNQIDGKGFSMVEVLSTCNINWGMTPVESLDFVKNDMCDYYKLGVYKDNGEIVGGAK